MKEFFPMTGTEAEWNTAYYRLEDYLRALRVVHRVHQCQIILRVLETAAARHLVQPDTSPTTLVMEEARAEMEKWFEATLEHQEPTVSAGLISLLATDAVEKWPSAFLAEEAPFEFQQAVREGGVQAMMDLKISSMVPRPLDLFSPIDAMAQPDVGGGRDHQIRLATWTVILAIVLSLFIFFIW